jgi:hypothetical protein
MDKTFSTAQTTLKLATRRALHQPELADGIIATRFNALGHCHLLVPQNDFDDAFLKPKRPGIGSGNNWQIRMASIVRNVDG